MQLKRSGLLLDCVLYAGEIPIILSVQAESNPALLAAVRSSLSPQVDCLSGPWWEIELVLGHKLKCPPCGQTPPCCLSVPCNLNSQWSKYGYVFLVHWSWVGGGLNSHCSSGSPHTLSVSDGFVHKMSFLSILLHIWPLKQNLWCDTLCLGGIGELPFRRECTTFHMAACSPAALREHGDWKPSGLSSPEEFLFLQDKLGSQKWHEGLYYCPISPKIMFLLCPLKFENVPTLHRYKAAYIYLYLYI